VPITEANPQQMRKLTGALLDLARLDVHKADVRRAEIDLAGVALQCIGQLQPLASGREITLKHDLSHACVANLAERLTPVVTNLLLNAISYNRPGGEVVVTTRNSGNYATLSVADNGIGIGSADLPYIFDRFYRADKVRSRAGGNTGLGLSICKAILDAEDGAIQVESEIGKGSVFTVRFPIA
jgi:signal transduction histidine kinase